MLIQLFHKGNSCFLGTILVLKDKNKSNHHRWMTLGISLGLCFLMFTYHQWHNLLRVAGKLSKGHGSDNALGSMSSMHIHVLCISVYYMIPTQDSRCWPNYRKSMIKRTITLANFPIWFITSSLSIYIYNYTLLPQIRHRTSSLFSGIYWSLWSLRRMP